MRRYAASTMYLRSPTATSTPVISFRDKNPLTLPDADIYIFIRVLIFLFTRLVAGFSHGVPSAHEFVKIRAKIILLWGRTLNSLIKDSVKKKNK